jgi:capsid protein
MFTRPEAERLLLRSALRDGEVFTQLVRGNVPGLQRYNFGQKCVFWAAIIFPALALANAARETLRMGDAMETGSRRATRSRPQRSSFQAG